jgi:tripartite-type tricarboxylate transporter receptor subunit TctC
MLCIAATVAASALALIVFAAPLAQAQNYPSKPIRFIVPFAAGGGNDIVARVIGSKIEPTLGQPVIIDNRTGGGGMIGSEAAARAEPDGHTLLLASFPHVVNPALRTKTAYDPIADFEAVTLVGASPNVLVVHPDLPVKTVKDLVEYVKANPGKLSYGSNSIGGSSHLGMELFKYEAGKLDIQHIPYRGSSPMLADLLSGRVSMAVDNLVFQIENIKAGKMRALAILTLERSNTLPELPTMVELGYPGFEVAPWFAVLVPAKTPAPIIQRLNGAILEALKDPEVPTKLPGSTIIGSTPSRAAQYLKSEMDKWGKIVREANIKAD